MTRYVIFFILKCKITSVNLFAISWEWCEVKMQITIHIKVKRNIELILALLNSSSLDLCGSKTNFKSLTKFLWLTTEVCLSMVCYNERDFIHTFKVFEITGICNLFLISVVYCSSSFFCIVVAYNYCTILCMLQNLHSLEFRALLTFSFVFGLSLFWSTLSADSKQMKFML